MNLSDFQDGLKIWWSLQTIPSRFCAFVICMSALQPEEEGEISEHKEQSSECMLGGIQNQKWVS